MLNKREIQLARRIGRRIRALRQERGWGQVDLSAHIDEFLTQPTLSYVENGSRLSSLRALLRIADAFEIDIAGLFLNPEESRREKILMAVWNCSETTLEHVAKLVDVE